MKERVEEARFSPNSAVTLPATTGAVKEAPLTTPPAKTVGIWASRTDGTKNHKTSASSTGRCNTSVKSFCRSFKLQRLTGPFVQLTCHLV